MGRLAAALLVLAGCGRFAFDDRVTDAVADSASQWGQPEMWSISPTGDDPALTGDLLEMYFNVGSADIYRTTRASTTDAWTTPAIVTELDVTQQQSTPEPTSDGLTMYFASARTGTLGGNDIWVTTRAARTDLWGAPVHIVELSSTPSDHPGNMTADGLTIVFDSHRLANTDDDLFIATRATTADPWDAPVEITDANLVAFNDESPFLTPDGLELYFDSSRTGKAQLYVSRRATRADAFGAPEHIDYLVTGTANQADPWVSPDGHDLVFASGSTIWHSTR